MLLSIQEVHYCVLIWNVLESTSYQNGMMFISKGQTHRTESYITNWFICIYQPGRTRLDRTAILGEIFAYFPLIFRRFSANGTPSAIFLPTCLWIMPNSTYFPPIFCLFFTYLLHSEMVPHPYYKLKHVTHLLFFCPHVYGFRLIFRSFST